MQITGGFLKGQHLYTPSSKSKEIRPLRTRIRKALFDILGHNLEGKSVLDLFAGTGALGIEALSRGAKLVVFVDLSPVSVEIIRKNLQKFKLEERAYIFRLQIPEEFPKLMKLMREHALTFDLVFITPPYEKGLALATLRKFPSALLKKEALVMVEERSSVKLPGEVGPFHLKKQKIYGETALYFYEPLGMDGQINPV